MLFEKAAAEDSKFPEDLDRVHSWFTTELTDSQRLVCLHDLLSMLNPSQHRFLFTSIAVDTQANEDETVWLDLAMSESQKLNRSGMMIGSVDDRLSRLDLSGCGLLGENLFSGLQVSASRSSSSVSGISSIEQMSSRSISPSSSTSKASASKVLSILKVDEDKADNDKSYEKVNDTSAKFTSTKTSNENDTSAKVTSTPTNHTSSNHSSAKISSPSSSQSSSPSSNSKAPPGLLSPEASEYRPSEPCCYPEVFMSDFGQWLRLLRLHKYHPVLQPVYEKGAERMLRLSEAQMEEAGVAALGARRKFLRLFERIRGELEVPNG